MGDGVGVTAADVGGPFDEIVASGRARYEELSRIETLIASRMTQSWTSIPHFYVGVTSPHPDLERVRGSRCTLTDLVVAAVARCVGTYPRANAWWADGRLLLHDSVDVGIAVATDHGLVVPVVHDAAGLSLDELSAARRDLVRRARARRLSVEEVTGGTITVSNVAPLGVHHVLPIINPPQTAIVGVGAPLRTSPPAGVSAEDSSAPFWMTLGGDHRALDGAMAGALLNDVARELHALVAA